jgi:hypothetical protein
MNEYEIRNDILGELAAKVPGFDWAPYGHTATVEMVEADQFDGFLTLHATLTAFTVLAITANWSPTIGQVARFVGGLDDVALLALADRRSVKAVADVALLDLTAGQRHVVIGRLHGAADALLGLAIELPLTSGLQFREDELGDVDFRWNEGDDNGEVES